MLKLILYLAFVKLYLVLKWICEIYKYIDGNNVLNKRKGITACRCHISRSIYFISEMQCLNKMMHYRNRIFYLLFSHLRTCIRKLASRKDVFLIFC